jgi:hypothetical protein
MVGDACIGWLGQNLTKLTHNPANPYPEDPSKGVPRWDEWPASRSKTSDLALDGMMAETTLAEAKTKREKNRMPAMQGQTVESKIKAALVGRQRKSAWIVAGFGICH